jgi:hypothetical protein
MGQQGPDHYLAKHHALRTRAVDEAFKTKFVCNDWDYLAD